MERYIIELSIYEKVFQDEEAGILPILTRIELLKEHPNERMLIEETLVDHAEYLRCEKYGHNWGNVQSYITTEIGIEDLTCKSCGYFHSIRHY